MGMGRRSRTPTGSVDGLILNPTVDDMEELYGHYKRQRSESAYFKSISDSSADSFPQMEIEAVQLDFTSSTISGPTQPGSTTYDSSSCQPPSTPYNFENRAPVTCIYSEFLDLGSHPNDHSQLVCSLPAILRRTCSDPRSNISIHVTPHDLFSGHRTHSNEALLDSDFDALNHLEAMIH